MPNKYTDPNFGPPMERHAPSEELASAHNERLARERDGQVAFMDDCVVLTTPELERRLDELQGQVATLEKQLAYASMKAGNARKELACRDLSGSAIAQILDGNRSSLDDIRALAREVMRRRAQDGAK